MDLDPFSCERHPPHLRGKEIGLFYAQRNRERQRIREEQRLLLERSLQPIDSGELMPSLNYSIYGVPTPDFYHVGPDITLPKRLIDEIEEKLTCESDSAAESICDGFKNYFRDILSSTFEKFLEKAAHNLSHSNIEEQNRQYLKPEISIDQSKLPVYKHRDEILKELNKSRFIIISGDTGCGKTTQIPQIILDSYINSDDCHIICTQPRRISAISVAERVAVERNEHLGYSVGYAIRLESKLPKSTGSILFCTTGILLRRLESDPLLQNVSHVIIDEIHERTVESDLLIGLLKIITKYNTRLRIILMSATIGIEEFSIHFTECSIIQIEGSLFPVEIKYLEDVLEETDFLIKHGKYLLRDKRQQCKNSKDKLYDMEFLNIILPYIRSVKGKYSQDILDIIQNRSSEEFHVELLTTLIYHIDETQDDGAILVFLSGYDKISRLYDELTKPSCFGYRPWKIYMLHSMMPTVDQKGVFNRPPLGIRKIILATNIAETSITIDDVVFVINTGKVKMTDYNLDKNYQVLEEVFVTKAHSKQRQGRAGRCQPGVCYNLYSRARENTLKDYPIPEIQRSRLEPIILNLKMLKIHDCKEFLGSLISPPAERAVDLGIRHLKRINALEENESLTPLGLHLARLPLDPQIGKMLLISAMFNCINPIASICATLSFRNPFYRPMGKEKLVDEARRKFVYSTNSDHLMFANVMEEFYWAKQSGNVKSFCDENFLAYSTLRQLDGLKSQLCDVLYGANFIDSQDLMEENLNMNSNNEELLRSVIAGGLYPNVACVRKSKQKRKVVNVVHKIETLVDKQNVQIHPGSVNANKPDFDSKYFVYYNLQKSNKIYLYDTTMVYPISLIIFGDQISTGYNQSNGKYYIAIARKDNFHCDRRSMDIILKLRHRFESFLKKLALHPKVLSSAGQSDDKNLIDALIILFSYEFDEYKEEKAEDEDQIEEDFVIGNF